MIGTPVSVCYTYIVLFIIFGAFLERTGIANFFISFANRLAGWSSGGPAKVAVISSALCGMVSGSSVGNTVTTGSFTIPMMKKPVISRSLQEQLKLLPQPAARSCRLSWVQQHS